MERGRFGAYRILSELGSGGAATVYRAEVVGEVRGLELGAEVALKVLHPHLTTNPGVFKRFRREVNVGQRLRHPNVVAIHDAGEETLGGRRLPYLAMEYVLGQTLRELLQEEGRQHEGLCRHVGQEVARGLEAIHRLGAVHRDLKPENILVTTDNAVKVMDLGVAHILDDKARISSTGDFIGSVLYAAPEQFAGSHSVGPATDLYALGLTLYELVTGRHPFISATLGEVMRLQMAQTPRRPSELNGQITSFFEQIVLTLLAKRPDQRFASASAVVEVLGEGESSEWWRRRGREIQPPKGAPRPRARLRRDAALHGREATVGRLRALFEDVKSGRGRTLLVLGEAGIGKSRLADDLPGLLHDAGEQLNYLYGACPPAGAGTGSGAFCTAYRDHLGADRLEGELSQRLDQASGLVPALAAFLRGEAVPPGAAAPPFESIQVAMLELTRSLAAERPTLVVIDDLHAAPPEGRELFLALARGLASHRVLLVGAARPGLPEDWLETAAAEAEVAFLELKRLGLDEVRGLLAEVLQSTHVADTLAARVSALSDGNPFFVLEILRDLKASGMLMRDATGRWALLGTPDDVKTPRGVKELIEAHISGLRDEDREVLDVASVLGTVFDPGIVADVLERPHLAVLKALGRLERDHHLVRSEGRRLTFDHHQVHETVYALVPALLREAYHAAIGEHLEKRVVRDAADEIVPSSLVVDACEHLRRGGREAKAAALLGPALRHLEESFHNESALELATPFLAKPGLITGRERVELIHRHAERLDLVGRRRDVAGLLEEAQRVADAEGFADLAARSRLLLATHVRQGGRPEDALELVKEAASLAEESGNEGLLARAYGAWGTISDDLGRYADARDHYERQIDIACRLGDGRSEGAARGNLAQILHYLGDHDGALRETERCAELLEATDDLLLRTKVTLNRGYLLFAVGRDEEGRLDLERSLEMARRIGYRRGEANALGNLGSMALDSGRLGDALAAYEQDLALQEDVGHVRNVVIAQGVLAEIETALGRLDRARAYADAGLARAVASGYRSGEAEIRTHLAQILSEEGRPDEARRELELAARLYEEMGDGDRRCAALAEVGETHLDEGHADDAEAACRRALATMDAREVHYGRNEALAVLARLGRATSDEVESLRAASAADADPRALFRYCLVLWRVTGEEPFLEQAHGHLASLTEHAPAEARDGVPVATRAARAVTEAWQQRGAHGA